MPPLRKARLSPPTIVCSCDFGMKAGARKSALVERVPRPESRRVMRFRYAFGVMANGDGAGLAGSEASEVKRVKRVVKLQNLH